MKVVSDTSMLFVLTERGIIGEALQLPWEIHTTDMVARLFGNDLNGRIYIESFSPDEMCELAVFQRQLPGKPHIAIQDSSALLLAKRSEYILLTGDVRVCEVASAVGITAYGLQEMEEIVSAHRLLVLQCVDSDKRASVSINPAFPIPPFGGGSQNVPFMIQ